MASHNLDHQPDERLVTEIADLKRRVSEMRTLQLQGSAALNYSRSGQAQLSQLFSANSGGYLVVAAENAEGKPIFVTFESSFYQDSIDLAHEIGTTLNGYRDHWDLVVQTVEHLSTDSYIYYRLYVFNHDVAPHTLYWIVRGRIIVAGAAV